MLDELTNIFGCKCINNFSPANNCLLCPDGFELDVSTQSCSRDDCVVNDEACASHGTCTINDQYVKICSCNEGFDLQTRCEKCLSGLSLKDNICKE